MAMSDRALIVCPGCSTRATKRPREFACAGSRGSTSFSISTSWRTTVEDLTRCIFVRSMVTRVLPVSASRVTSQRGGGATVEDKARTIWSYHIRPRELADFATEMNVKQLVTMHERNYTDPYDPDALMKEFKRHYSGTVYSARDGDVF